MGFNLNYDASYFWAVVWLTFNGDYPTPSVMIYEATISSILKKKKTRRELTWKIAYS